MSRKPSAVLFFRSCERGASPFNLENLIPSYAEDITPYGAVNCRNRDVVGFILAHSNAQQLIPRDQKCSGNVQLESGTSSAANHSEGHKGKKRKESVLMKIVHRTRKNNSPIFALFKSKNKDRAAMDERIGGI